MNMLYRSLKYILILSLLVSMKAIAQPGPPGDPGGDPDNPVPITGIEILIAAGAALGIKRISDLKKRN